MADATQCFSLDLAQAWRSVRVRPGSETILALHGQRFFADMTRFFIP